MEVSCTQFVCAVKGVLSCTKLSQTTLSINGTQYSRKHYHKKRATELQPDLEAHKEGAQVDGMTPVVAHCLHHVCCNMDHGLSNIQLIKTRKGLFFGD